MSDDTFRALWIEQPADDTFTRGIVERRVADLPAGDVLVEVYYSSLNYKDALSAHGHTGVTKTYPHTPGIDAAGVVRESSDARFQPGQQVIVSGYDFGMNTHGGLAQMIRVPADWVVPLPSGLSMADAMKQGTAGFTVAYCVHMLQRHGIAPEQGELVVTGATGGVGSLSIALLSKLGYDVAAVTGKASEADRLKKLGAKSIVERNVFLEKKDRPILKPQWAGGIDTAGGDVLNTLYKSTKYGGAIACCGMAASPMLETNVYPLILRSVSLLGIASADCPMTLRLALWEKLATEWSLPTLDDLIREITLDEVPEALEAMLAGQSRGRWLVRLR